jgi:hypothetical protein
VAGLKAGEKTEAQCHESRHDKGHDKHAAIERDGVHPRNLHRCEGHESLDSK